MLTLMFYHLFGKNETENMCTVQAFLKKQRSFLAEFSNNDPRVA